MRRFPEAVYHVLRFSWVQTHPSHSKEEMRYKLLFINKYKPPPGSVLEPLGTACSSEAVHTSPQHPQINHVKHCLLLDFLLPKNLIHNIRGTSSPCYPLYLSSHSAEWCADALKMVWAMSWSTQMWYSHLYLIRLHPSEKLFQINNIRSPVKRRVGELIGRASLFSLKTWGILSVYMQPCGC